MIFMNHQCFRGGKLRYNSWTLSQKLVLLLHVLILYNILHVLIPMTCNIGPLAVLEKPTVSRSGTAHRPRSCLISHIIASFGHEMPLKLKCQLHVNSFRLVSHDPCGLSTRCYLFPECVARVPISLGGLGVRLCSPSFAFAFATVRKCPQPLAVTP